MPSEYTGGMFEKNSESAPVNEKSLGQSEVRY